MTNEIKSGGKIVATITQRHVVAFQFNIPGTNDMQSLDVPVWANTIAIDADGSIWAYESTAEDVCIPDYSRKAWVDCGPSENKMRSVGEMDCFPDWAKAKIDLRGLK